MITVTVVVACDACGAQAPPLVTQGPEAANSGRAGRVVARRGGWQTRTARAPEQTDLCPTCLTGAAAPPALPEGYAGPRYTARFVGQAWVNDYAMDCDPEGDEEWDCTAEFLALAQTHPIAHRALLDELGGGTEALDRNDLLFGDPASPQWVRDWGGPFSIYVRSDREGDALTEEEEDELLRAEDAEARLAGPRYLVAEDWTHLDATEREYDLRWVIDRHEECLVAAQHRTAREPGWRDVGRGAHWTDVAKHLDDNDVYDRYADFGEAIVLADALPAWAHTAPEETPDA